MYNRMRTGDQELGNKSQFTKQTSGQQITEGEKETRNTTKKNLHSKISNQSYNALIPKSMTILPRPATAAVMVQQV